MKPEKHVKNIYVILGLLMFLVVAMSVTPAFGATTGNSDSRSSVIVEKGKVYDDSGELYTGWYTLNKHRYYAENGKRIAGWKRISKKYYYFNSDYTLAKNKIVGSASKGYYYVDRSGIRVTDKEIRQAVDFVVKNSGSNVSQRERLRQCFKALCKYSYMHRETVLPKASQLPGYAEYMFNQHQGNCYYYGTTLAYISRVLGYDSRLAAGGVTARGPGYALSSHGWCEVHVDSGWKLMDCSMQNAHSNVNLFFIAREKYPYRLRCDKTYELTVKDGKVSWK